MAPSESRSGQHVFRRTLFGYRRADVETYVDETTHQLQAEQDELDRLREASASHEQLGKHLAALMVRFAESVEASEREAAARANQIVADAQARAATIEAEARQLLVETRDLAAATYAEAGRRYEAVTAARNVASERIEVAIERMADALASLMATPAFPDLELPVPILSDTGDLVGFEQTGSGGHGAHQPQPADAGALDLTGEEALGRRRGGDGHLADAGAASRTAAGGEAHRAVL